MKFMATLYGRVCSKRIGNKNHLCKQRSLGTSSLTSDVPEESIDLFRVQVFNFTSLIQSLDSSFNSNKLQDRRHLHSIILLAH